MVVEGLVIQGPKASETMILSLPRITQTQYGKGWNMEKMADSFQTKIYSYFIKLFEQFIKLSCMNFYIDLSNKNITKSETEKKLMDKQIDEHTALTTVIPKELENYKPQISLAAQ